MKASSLHKIFEPVALEINQRPVRQSKLDILHDNTNSPGWKYFARPGSLLLFAARDSSRLEELKTALAEGGAKAESLRQTVLNSYQNRKELDANDPAGIIIKQDVVAELSYHGTALISHLFVPEDLSLAVFEFPYNGGRLDSSAFVLTERYRDDNASLSVLMLKTDPPLTNAERAALKQVPADQVVNNISTDLWCETTWYAMAALVGMAVVGGMAVMDFADLKPQDSVTLSDEEIQRLGPTASARRLVSLRRQALLRPPPVK